MGLLLLVIGGLRFRERERERERETLISNLERERERDGRKIVVKWEEWMKGVSFIGIGLGYSLKCPLLLMWVYDKDGGI